MPVDNSLLLKKAKEAEAKASQQLQPDSSSESDSDEEEMRSISSPKPKAETIGPPKILQFKPELKEAVEVEAPSPVFSIPTEPVDNISQFMHGFNVHVQGGDRCEFCEGITKAWPTIDEQQELSPEEVLSSCVANNSLDSPTKRHLHSGVYRYADMSNLKKLGIRFRYWDMGIYT